MPIGTVKWFNNAKGWGFIVPEQGGEDIFVHFSVIQGTGYKTLIAGQQVNYSVESSQKGLHASEVTPLDKTELKNEPSEPLTHNENSESTEKNKETLSK